MVSVAHKVPSRAVAGFSDIKACCQKEVVGAGLKEPRDQNVGPLVLLTTSNPELGQKDRREDILLCHKFRSILGLE